MAFFIVIFNTPSVCGGVLHLSAMLKPFENKPDAFFGQSISRRDCLRFLLCGGGLFFDDAAFIGNGSRKYNRFGHP